MPVCYSENKIPFLDLDADESQFVPTDLLIYIYGVCVHACIMVDVTHNKRLVIPLHARTHTHTDEEWAEGLGDDLDFSSDDMGSPPTHN